MFEFWTKQQPPFGERGYWKCLICGASGSDEPGVNKTAQEMADAHINKVRQHYNAVRLEPREDDRRGALVDVMQAEMSIFGGQLAVKDCAVIGARIGDEHYEFAMRERDKQNMALIKERNLLRRALDDLIREAHGTLRSPDWTLQSELANKD